MSPEPRPSPNGTPNAPAGPLERPAVQGLTTPLLRRKELLQRYKCSASTLHRWTKAGLLPDPIRFGQPLWRLADLEAAELAGQLCPAIAGQAVQIVHLKPRLKIGLEVAAAPAAVQKSAASVRRTVRD